MTLKDKYTYLALMALAMFGIGFWMLSIGGGASQPPSIPDPLAQQSSVADQFKGSLNLGDDKVHDQMEETLKKVLLIPDTFEQFGTTKCEKGEEVVRNFLKPGQTSYYLSHESDLTAREYLRRIDPVNFYHLILHYNSKENKWASLGTQVGNIAITGEKLDTYKIPAGEPVLVILIGLQEDEDKAAYLDIDTGETKQLVYVEHCENSFPKDVPKLNDGWNLLVSDLVQIADDPHALSVSALDASALVASMDLNVIQNLSNQVEGILSWVNYDSKKTREGFNDEVNVPRLSFDLQSEPEVVLTYSKLPKEIATYHIHPQNSPNIKAVALRATNIEGFEFSDLFNQVFFRVNGERLEVSDLDSDTLIAYFDDLNSDDLFANGPMKISVMAKTHAENSVENLQLGMAFDLGDTRIAKSKLPPVFVEFESIVADTYFEIKDSDVKLDSLELADGPDRATLVFKLLNNTRNAVDINSIFLPFKSKEGLTAIDVTPGLVKPNLKVEDYDGNQKVLVNSEGIYLFPNRELTLTSRQPRIIPVVITFNSQFDGKFEFGKIEIDTNEVSLDYDKRAIKLAYAKTGDAPTNNSQTTRQRTSDTDADESDSPEVNEPEDSPTVAVNSEAENAFGNLFGGSSSDSNEESDEPAEDSNEPEEESDEGEGDSNEPEEQESLNQEQAEQNQDGEDGPPQIEEGMFSGDDNNEAPENRLSVAYSTSLEEEFVRLVHEESQNLFMLELRNQNAFNGINLVDFYNVYGDHIRLEVESIQSGWIDWYLDDDTLTDQQLYAWYYDTFVDAEPMIRIRKISNEPVRLSNTSFELLDIYDGSSSVELPDVNVVQLVESMSEFNPLASEFNALATDQAQEFTLMEFDYTFYMEDLNWLEIYNVIMEVDDLDGVELEIRYMDDTLLDPGQIPDSDNLTYPVKLVATFDSGYFLENPSLSLNVGFTGSEDFVFEFLLPEPSEEQREQDLVEAPQEESEQQEPEALETQAQQEVQEAPEAEEIQVVPVVDSEQEDPEDEFEPQIQEVSAEESEQEVSEDAEEESLEEIEKASKEKQEMIDKSSKIDLEKEIIKE